MSDLFGNGSTWVRADFHLHTRADKEFNYVQSKEDLAHAYPPENTFPADYIDSLKKAGIGIGVVTNHNKFDCDEFHCLAKKANREGILLVPGIELSVNEGKNGIHVLVAFSEDWIAEGKNFIGQFLATVFTGKAPDVYENENGKTDKNLLAVINALEAFGKDFFIIFAHVNQSSGLFFECGGGKLKEWKNEAYRPLLRRTLAFQKVRDNESRKNARNWFGGRYPAEVEGSDCKSLADIGTKEGETWLKLGDLSFSAVKYALTDYKERVRDALPDRIQRIDRQKQKISNLAFSLSKSSDVDEELAENRKKLEDASFNLKKFSDMGIDGKLRRQTAFDNDERWLQSVQEMLAHVKQSSAEGLQELEAGISAKITYISEYNADILSDEKGSLNTMLQLVGELKSIYGKIYTQIELFSEQSKAFLEKKRAAEEEFAKIRRDLEAELRGSGQQLVNINDFKTLNIRIAQAKEMIALLTNQKKERGDIHSTLMNALTELNELHREEFKIIQEELSKINGTETGLSIMAEFKGDKDAFLSMMKSTFKGSRMRESTYREIADGYLDFAAIYRDEDFGTKHDGIKTVFESVFEEQLSALLTYRVPDKITVMYQGKPLHRHSLGQRASALILFILSRQDSDVIIIDQPEDDLDNQTVYNDVIKLLKKVKPNVQCIFATHNANFPVLGDAEMISAFDYSENAVTVLQGNIDSRSTQDKIISIMEGGKEAFERREEIYQSWKR